VVSRRPRRGPWLGLALALGVAARAASAQAPAEARGGGVEQAGSAADLALLDAPVLPGDDAEVAHAFGRLLALGEEGAARALEGFESAGATGRRARARLVGEVGGPAVVPAVLALLDDPDPAVRRELLRMLGRPSLGDAHADARVAALERRAALDPAPAAREEAVLGLVRSGLAGAVDALERLLETAPPEQRKQAAQGFASLPAARARVLARVRREAAQGGGSGGLEASTLAPLVEAYGRALAETPGGGERPEERAPIETFARSPSLALRAGALLAFDRLVDRLAERQESERLGRLLSRFAADGWTPPQLAYRRAHYAVAVEADPGAALEAAERLELASRGDDPAAGIWRFYGAHFRAVAELLRGRLEPAARGFAEAREAALALGELREDLAPSLYARRMQHPRAPIAGSVAVDRLHLAAMEEIWSALVGLLRSPPGSDAAGAALHEPLVRAHGLLLEAQLAERRSDANLQGGTWDAPLDQDLGPRRLLLTNGRWDPPGGHDRLDLAVELARAIAAVAPLEMPGFGPHDEAARAAWLEEPRRRELLRRILDAEIDQLERQADELQRRGLPGDLRLRQARIRAQEKRRDRRRVEQALGRLAAQGAPSAAELLEAGAPLLDLRTPSTHALTLADDLRAEGRAAEANRLSSALLEDLRGGLPGMSPILAEWTSARVELSIASSMMDEDEPRQAEEQGLLAVGRLEALINTVERWRDQAGDDAEMALQAAAYLRQTRAQLANALLSLAVNANVRLNDKDKALGYFERAYALDKSDFMRVLLACYRARSGERAEAMAVLAGVEPTPRLYYNLACTYALLGMPEEALDYLQLEFSENLDSPGALLRQKRWARDDPDLASLRELPRFQRLIAE